MQNYTKKSSVCLVGRSGLDGDQRLSCSITFELFLSHLHSSHCLSPQFWPLECDKLEEVPLHQLYHDRIGTLDTTDKNSRCVAVLTLSSMCYPCTSIANLESETCFDCTEPPVFEECNV